MIVKVTVGDLKDNFQQIENSVNNGNHVYLTKHEHDSMVVLSLSEYSALTTNIEQKLDEADELAKNKNNRLTHEQVFDSLKNFLSRKTSY